MTYLKTIFTLNPVKNKVQFASSAKTNLRLRVKNAARIIRELDHKRACGNDKITGKQLLFDAIKHLNKAFNEMTPIGHFPIMLRTFAIITVAKPR